MLKILGLTKQFADYRALDNLSLEINAGEIYCLLGSNGAGKSTTINLILGFLRADSGEIFIDNTRMQVDNKAALLTARGKIAYIPEQMNLYQEFNAIENLRYLAQLSGLTPSQHDFVGALTQTGLADNMWHKPLKHYSKGMRQKVGIAFAIIRQAKLLLLDEPTSGLDPSAMEEFVAIVKMLTQQGAAVLMVSHDLACAAKLGDKFSILKQGQQLATFTKQGLCQQSLEQRYHQAINPKSVSLSA